MPTVRCAICRLRFQTLKSLYIHYVKFHSKARIIQKLLEQNSRQVVLLKSPKKQGFKLSKQVPKISKLNKISKIETFETETFIIQDNIRIFSGENHIISIGSDEDSVKLSFNNESQDHYYLAWNKNNKKFRKLPTKIQYNTKRKTKKKKVVRRKKQDYHVNITRLKDTISLDDQTGIFYTCHCRETDFQSPDSGLFTSDTESCSETSKNSAVQFEESKLFCNKCGSGYKTELALSEHMYIHQTFCRLCNTWFANEYSFKQHMQLHKMKIFSCHICSAEFLLKESLFQHIDSHMEDKILEDVLDMEQRYKTFHTGFLNNDYSTSINNILSYLKERPDSYYCNVHF